MRQITFRCEGPFDRAADDVTGTCQRERVIGWDDPSPEGWTVTQSGADLCDRCGRW